MKIKDLRRYVSLATLVLMTCAHTASAQQPALQGYIMTVYEDSAFGELIVDGNNKQAIEKLSKRGERKTPRLEESINLCVAYTKVRQLEEATRFCDAAIVASRKRAKFLKRSNFATYRHMADTGHAIALTNRGVLHLLTDERAEALELFKTAMNLDSKEESARKNLSVLEARLGSNES